MAWKKNSIQKLKIVYLSMNKEEEQWNKWKWESEAGSAGGL